MILLLIALYGLTSVVAGMLTASFAPVAVWATATGLGFCLNLARAAIVRAARGVSGSEG